MNGTGIDYAVVLLAGALFVSLIIERMLEILKSIYDVLEAHFGWYTFWNQRAIRLRHQLDDLISSKSMQSVQHLLGFDRLQSNDSNYQDAYSIAVASVRIYSIKFATKILGCALGMIIAISAHIDIFILVDNLIHVGEHSIKLPPLLTELLTGIAMGLGSGPLHKLIAALESAKNKRQSVN